MIAHVAVAVAVARDTGVPYFNTEKGVALRLYERPWLALRLSRACLAASGWYHRHKFILEIKPFFNHFLVNFLENLRSEADQKAARPGA